MKISVGFFIRIIIRSMSGIPRVAFRPALNDVVKRKVYVLFPARLYCRLNDLNPQEIPRVQAEKYD